MLRLLACLDEFLFICVLELGASSSFTYDLDHGPTARFKPSVQQEERKRLSSSEKRIRQRRASSSSEL